MPKLYGRNWTPEELRSRTGGAEQLAGVERVILDDGSARGVRAANLRTGAGLEVQVLLDRALDLGRASFRGRSLAYQAPCGTVHPAFYDSQGLNWLRTFGCGLMVTCGLQNVGVPCEDEGQSFGLHGGISATPADELSVQSGWKGAQCRFRIAGRMREVTPRGLFGPNLALTRSISSALGAHWIEIEDVVENEGFAPSALMLLYHINLGFPLLDEGGRVLLAASKTEPRDAAARAGWAHWSRVEAPQAGYREQVFAHEMIAGPRGRARAALVAPQRPGGEALGLCLEYDANALPRFTQWKMLGAGAYVMGLEPANCTVLGRAEERRRGTLQTIAPGERRTFRLKLSVLSSADEIVALETELAALQGRGGRRQRGRR